MGINILFGTTSQTTTKDNDNTDTVEQKMQNGAVVSIVHRYTETIKIADETQILREFLALLELVKANSNRFDPDFKMVIDPKTRKCYKAYRCWSEHIPL